MEILTSGQELQPPQKIEESESTLRKNMQSNLDALQMSKSDEEDLDTLPPRMSLKKHYTNAVDARKSTSRSVFSNPASKSFVNSITLDIVYNKVTK